MRSPPETTLSRKPFSNLKSKIMVAYAFKRKSSFKKFAWANPKILIFYLNSKSVHILICPESGTLESLMSWNSSLEISYNFNKIHQALIESSAINSWYWVEKHSDNLRYCMIHKYRITVTVWLISYDMRLWISEWPFSHPKCKISYLPDFEWQLDH